MKHLQPKRQAEKRMALHMALNRQCDFPCLDCAGPWVNLRLRLALLYIEDRRGGIR